MTKQKIKLQTALIEQGKEVESMDATPDAEAMQISLDCLKTAMQLKDMRGMRVYARKLAAQSTKFQIDKL